MGQNGSRTGSPLRFFFLFSPILCVREFFLTVIARGGENLGDDRKSTTLQNKTGKKETTGCKKGFFINKHEKDGEAL